MCRVQKLRLGIMSVGPKIDEAKAALLQPDASCQRPKLMRRRRPRRTEATEGLESDGSFIVKKLHLSIYSLCKNI